MCTVLGIDVGIKNLSLCILEKTSEGIKILLWDNYDIIDQVMHCSNCKFKARFKDTKAANVYCLRHSKGKECKEIKNKLVSSFTLQDIATKTIEKLNAIYDKDIFDKLDKVFIEKQPRVNNKMQFVSNVIFGKLVELLPHTKIRFVQANKKLFGQAKAKEFKGKKGYANRKNLSVDITLEHLKLVQDSDTWTKFLGEKAKKNDLADSFGFAMAGLALQFS